MAEHNKRTLVQKRNVEMEIEITYSQSKWGRLTEDGGGESYVTERVSEQVYRVYAFSVRK